VKGGDFIPSSCMCGVAILTVVRVGGMKEMRE